MLLNLRASILKSTLLFHYIAIYFYLLLFIITIYLVKNFIPFFA